MTTRIFGALKGAGTQIREASATKPIQEGPLGFTALVGIFRSGPVGEVVVHGGGLGDYRRVRGGLSQDSEAPLAAEHFYEVGGGAGVLATVRVTDGTEVASSLTLYDRDVELGVLERSPPAKLASAVIVMDAHNGGRWAGRQAVKAGDVGALSGVISGSTIDLGFATLEGKWTGAVLSFPDDDPGVEYAVTGNTAAGVFTVAGEFTAEALAGTSGVYLLELENVHELTGKPEYLALEVADSAEVEPGISLYVHRDGDQVKAWEDLDLNSAGSRYWFDALTAEDADNYELDPTDNFAGDPANGYKRPANYAEIPAPGGVATNVLTLQVVRWALDDSATSSGFDPALDTVNDVTWGSSPRAAVIVLTFTNATDYDVTATFLDGGETADDLPSGTIDVAYSSPNAYLPGWTLVSGGTAPQAGDVVTIYARTLPEGLADRGAWLYVAAGPDDGDTLTRYRVVDNDHESVTLAPSVDLTGEVDAPGAPTMTGTIAGPFNLAGGEEWIYTVGGSGPYTLANTVIGAAVTATALAAELNGLELARAGGAADKLVTFEATTAEKIKITALQDFGAPAILLAGSGTLNAKIGITNAQSATGSTPTRVRLQWRQELAGGYDGIAAITADDYADAWAVGSSPLNALITENTGVIRLAMPGVTDADAQAAAMLYAYEVNGLFYAEIPESETTEAAAIAWHKANLAIGSAQDYHAVPWPSYGQIRSPYGSGLYTAPLSGLILGLTAKRAVAAGGYHDAPAGLDWSLSPYVKAYPAGFPSSLNNEVLNGYGLIEVRKRGPRFYLWGDRIAGDGARGWLHKRLTVSHVGRTLLVNTDALVFKRINAATFADVKRLLIGLFAPWYRLGWFADTNGPDFTDQVLIKVDESNNPAAERALGNLHAAIAFDVVDTSERVIFTIGPTGVSEG